MNPKNKTKKPKNTKKFAWLVIDSILEDFSELESVNNTVEIFTDQESALDNFDRDSETLIKVSIEKVFIGKSSNQISDLKEINLK